MEAYNELVRIFTRLYRFQHAAAILSWDMLANMPLKGEAARSAARAELDLTMHHIITDAKLKPLIDAATEGSEALNELQKANLYEIRREWIKSNKLPPELVEKKAEVTSRVECLWPELRQKNDWEGFRPHLEEVVALVKEEARLLSQDTDLSPYEALLDQYEPGMRVAKLKEVFGSLRTWLPGLVQDVLKKNAEEPALVEATGNFPVPAQEALGKELMKILKFDFDGGRVDTSAHPFCGGVAEDVRMTTRYYTHDFSQSLMGIVHETGHARYEQNRPADWVTQPAGCARSMGVHESQSLFFEMQMGRSPQFISLILPLLKKHLGEHPAFEHNNLVRLYQRVKPDYIRVDADEVTYPLHVMLRFEIELELIEGNLEVKDLPALWNKKMKDYLGIDTEGNYKDGCMQDVHWSGGAIGYFPTYTLGAMYAAQLMHTCRQQLGSAQVDKAIESGEMQPIFDWLNKNVWSKGSLYSVSEILQQATGEDLNAKYFREHLERRYLHRKS